MTDRRKLSNAIKTAARKAVEYNDAQTALHEAFEAVYGFDLDLEELGEGEKWVDAIVYGHGEIPSLADLDNAVANLRENDEDRTSSSDI